jgi:hypothetical protein
MAAEEGGQEVPARHPLGPACRVAEQGPEPQRLPWPDDPRPDGFADDLAVVLALPADPSRKEDLADDVRLPFLSQDGRDAANTRAMLVDRVSALRDANIEALWQVAFRTFPSGPAVMLAGVCGTANSVMAPAEVTRAMSVARYSVLQRFRSGPVFTSVTHMQPSGPGLMPTGMPSPGRVNSAAEGDAAQSGVVEFCLAPVLGLVVEVEEGGGEGLGGEARVAGADVAGDGHGCHVDAGALLLFVQGLDVGAQRGLAD